MKLKCKSIIRNINLKSEKGSSSVLVIMIMLLLITFGVLAMMSSYSNLKIARKHADWTKDYYRLESNADKTYMEFENLYKAVVEEMDHYLSNDLEIGIESSSLPELVKNALLTDIDANENELCEQKLFLYLLYDKFYNSPIYLLDTSISFNYDIVNEDILNDEEPEISYITVDEETGRQLLTSIKINALNYKNYPEIKEWRELPREFQYDDSIYFNDPEENLQ